MTGPFSLDAGASWPFSSSCIFWHMGCGAPETRRSSILTIRGYDGRRGKMAGELLLSWRLWTGLGVGPAEAPDGVDDMSALCRAAKGSVGFGVALPVTVAAVELSCT
jgi:hypothetical protein